MRLKFLANGACERPASTSFRGVHTPRSPLTPAS
jgi:hypothetical protein